MLKIKWSKFANIVLFNRLLAPGGGGLYTMELEGPKWLLLTTSSCILTLMRIRIRNPAYNEPTYLRISVFIQSFRSFRLSSRLCYYPVVPVTASKENF